MKGIGFIILTISIMINTFWELYNISEYWKQKNLAGVIWCIFSMIVVNIMFVSGILLITY